MIIEIFNKIFLKVDYLNEYNELMKEKVYPLLDAEHKEYLTRKTEKFEYSHNLIECNSYSTANSLKFNIIYPAALLLNLIIFKFLLF